MKNGQFYDFWPVFVFLAHFYRFLGGISNIFWTLSIMGGDHGSTVIFALFIFCRFLDFWPIFGIFASVEIWGFFGSASEL